MTKRVLIIISSILFFFLAGLTALYLYIIRPTTQPSALLDFVPEEVSCIIRIRETSATLTSFFAHPVINDLQALEEIGHYWHLVDSITSRNYKTSDILRNETSYICLDSAQHYFILLNLPEKTNEYFIDQFLVNAGKVRKVVKTKEGVKAFYPEETKPLFYFVKNNVFGISPDKKLLVHALEHYQVPHPLDSMMGRWDAGTNAGLSVWGKKHSEKNILSHFLPQGLGFEGYLDSLSVYYWFDVELKNNTCRIQGELIRDSLAGWPRQLSENGPALSLRSMSGDSALGVDKLFCFNIVDSAGIQRPVIFFYHQYLDSAGNTHQMVMIEEDIKDELYRLSLRDTSSQLISMADPGISRINVVHPSFLKKISTYPFFSPAPERIFLANTGTFLLISDNTETILAEGTQYEEKFSESSDSEKRTMIRVRNHIRSNSAGHTYLHDLVIKAEKKHTCRFQLNLTIE